MSSNLTGHSLFETRSSVHKTGSESFSHHCPVVQLVERWVVTPEVTGSKPVGTAMKQCAKCKVSKELSEFNKHSGRVDGLQSICRVCDNSRAKAYYGANSKRQMEQIHAARKRRQRSLQDWLCDYLSQRSCMDCGERDLRVLEFDHVTDDKEANISRLLMEVASKERLLAEINKCEVVCANCHRIRTVQRANSYRQRYLYSRVAKW